MLGQLGLAVGEFAVVPPGWGERRLTLVDTEYNEELTAEAEPFTSTWWTRKPDLWRGEWPADVSVVHVAGSAKWGAFRTQGGHHGWHPPLADERFLRALQEAGLTEGWHSAPIDVRGRDWEPRSTHQAVFVETRAPWKFPDEEEAWGALTRDDRFFAWAVAPDDIDVGDAAFLWHDNGLFASPAAAAVLAAAKLPSLTLKPLIYASELEASIPGSVLDHPPGP